MSYRREFPTDTGLGGGANPSWTYTHLVPGGADSTAEVLRLRLQGQELLTRALEVENATLHSEVNRLRECIQARNSLVRDQLDRHPPRQRPLSERIDPAGPQPLPNRVVSGRGRPFTPRTGPPLPPTVAVRPLDIHPRFLPLGENFQEGGTGGPRFSQPQEWPDAIANNPSARPRGVRHWGSHPVNLDDLHIHTQIGQMVYGGNRPPGRRDPVDSGRRWKAIEAAFFRETVAIILQPDLFLEARGQFAPNQPTPLRQPFLAYVEDPNQLVTRDVIQHLIQSGVTESWIKLDTVVGFARSYLRDWARHQTAGVIATTELGRLFRGLYPNGITNQDDPQFVEDAAMSQEKMQEGTPAEIAMEEDDDEMPPLESRSPSTVGPPMGSPRAQTPLDERLDWGDDEL